MSVHEPDGVGEVFDEVLRGAIMIGGQLARHRAARRAEQLRQAARESVESARAELDRQHALKQQSLRPLDGVAHAAWWDHADAAGIRDAWLAARDWQAEDPRAANAVWKMAEELRKRHGLDVTEVDPAAFGRQHQLPERASLTVGEIRALQAQLDTEQHEAVQRLRAAHHPDSPAAAQDVERLTARVDELQELRDLAQRAISPDPDSALARERATRREDRDATVTAAAAASTDVARELRDTLAVRLADAGLAEDEVQAQVLGVVAQPDAPSAAVSSRRAPRASKTPTARRPALKQQRRR
jgi:hypothetical protein